MAGYWQQLRRIALPLVVVLVIIWLYAGGAYLAMPKALDSLSSCLIRVELGFLLAHLTGKWAFPKVTWGTKILEMTDLHILRIILYAGFISAAAVGG